MAKKNLKEQLSDVLEIKIQLLNLIYIFAEEVSVNVYHAHNRINFWEASLVLRSRTTDTRWLNP